MSICFLWTQSNVKTVLYWTIQSIVSTVLMSKTFPFQKIQFNISTQVKCKYKFNCQTHFYFKLFNLVNQFYFKQFSWAKVYTLALSGASIPGQSGPESNGNEGVLRIPQSPSITGTSPWDCLVSYQDTRWWWPYPSAELQSLYSTTSADGANFDLSTM